MTQLPLTIDAPTSPSPSKWRAGTYTCTYCWNDNSLSDAAEAAYCRVCDRRDQLRAQVPGQLHGLDARCPNPPEGYLRCTDALAPSCPVCSAQAAYQAGVAARRRDDEASREAVRNAKLHVDFIRENGARGFHYSLLRVWDEDGYEAGYRRLAACGDPAGGDVYEDMRREFRRFPLTYAETVAGKLAPIPGGVP